MKSLISKSIGIAIVLMAGLSFNVAAGPLTISSSGVTNIAATTAKILLTVGETNGYVRLFYGPYNGGATTNWTYSTSKGLCETGAVEAALTGLVSGVKYYYRANATNESTNVWMAATSNFITLATAPTGDVPISIHAVMADTNGILKAPTNFFAANSNAIIEAVGTPPSDGGATNIAAGEADTYDEATRTLTWNTNAAAPNMLLGITAADAYRGDWGNAVSNRAEETYAIATNADAVAASAYAIATNANAVAATAYAVATNAEANIFKLYRYAAQTTENEEIYVLATTTNITASRAGTTITLNIPAGTRLLSVVGRWPGNTLGSTFTLALGTNDMANADAASRWPAVGFAVWREDTRAQIVGATVKLGTDYDRIEILGLWTGGVNKWSIGF